MIIGRYSRAPSTEGKSVTGRVDMYPGRKPSNQHGGNSIVRGRNERSDKNSKKYEPNRN